MRVLKRNEEYEDVSFDKVLMRLKKLSSDLNINVSEIAQKVCTRIYDGVKTCELDELAAYLCSSMSIDNPDYSTLLHVLLFQITIKTHPHRLAKQYKYYMIIKIFMVTIHH